MRSCMYHGEVYHGGCGECFSTPLPISAYTSYQQKNMITIDGPKFLYCDIDNTLALWQGDTYHPNPECVEFIKKFHARGHKIIAWSAGGALWAEKVVLEFGLEKYVTLCISKPDWYLDDLKSEEFMPEANRIIVKSKFDNNE